MNDQDARLIKEQLGRIERQVDFLSYFACIVIGGSMGILLSYLLPSAGGMIWDLIN